MLSPMELPGSHLHQHGVPALSTSQGLRFRSAVGLTGNDHPRLSNPTPHLAGVASWKGPAGRGSRLSRIWFTMLHET
eukprot:11915332-Alexandrium_andersonii.AAC.1